MNRLTITRSASTDQGTPGSACLRDPDGNQLWAAHSLELPWRDNAPNVSCIPAGEYMARAQVSTRFGYTVYVLINVPGRSNCEMHNGNWCGDITKGWKSDVEGCTIFGTDAGTLAPPNMLPQMAVLHSDAARQGLLTASGGAIIEVDYVWAPGCAP